MVLASSEGSGTPKCSFEKSHGTLKKSEIVIFPIHVRLCSVNFCLNHTTYPFYTFQFAKITTF